MSPRALILTFLFYIVPIALFGYGIIAKNVVLDLLGLIWLISAFVINLMKS